MNQLTLRSNKKEIQGYGNPNRYIKVVFVVVGLAFSIFGFATIGSKEDDQVQVLLSLAEITYGLFMIFYAFYIFPLPMVSMNDEIITYRTNPFSLNFKTEWSRIQEVTLGKNFLKITLVTNEPKFFYIHSKYEQIQEGMRLQLKRLKERYKFDLIEQDINPPKRGETSK
ncbi:MAG: hypothetical protein ACOCXH_12395 [Cyclobacteriaceae bacterium]